MVSSDKERKQVLLFSILQWGMETKRVNSFRTVFGRLGYSAYPPELAAQWLNFRVNHVIHLLGGIVSRQWTLGPLDLLFVLAGNICSKYKTYIRTVLLGRLARVIWISWWSQERDLVCSANVQIQQAVFPYGEASDNSLKDKYNFFPEVGRGGREKQGS